jgi:hypothetical protein
MEIMMTAWSEKAPAKMALMEESRFMNNKIQEQYQPYDAVAPVSDASQFSFFYSQ